VAEGIDPATYRDASWGSDSVRAGQAVHTAVVMNIDRTGITARVGKDFLRPAALGVQVDERTTMEGVLKRGDIIHIRLSEDSKTKARTWVLDQLPVVQGRHRGHGRKNRRGARAGRRLRLSALEIQPCHPVAAAGPARRFKPFVYARAFEKGLTPADTLFDEPIAIPVGNQTYAPKNYYGKYSGVVTIQRALELSITCRRSRRS